MCGRYALKTPPDVLRALLALQWMRYGLVDRYNIAPTQIVPVARVGENGGAGSGAGGRELVGLRWGLIPVWARDRSIGSRLINARSESAATTPAFRAAFRRRRCVIPASGFYEWKKDGTSKQPYYVRRVDEQPLIFAGLWESWTDRGTGELIESCTILTTEPNETLRELHDRMPVVLDQERWEHWLDPGEQDPAKLMPLLAAAPGSWFTMSPVSTRVNSPKNDDPSLIEPVIVADVPEKRDGLLD